MHDSDRFLDGKLQSIHCRDPSTIKNSYAFYALFSKCNLLAGGHYQIYAVFGQLKLHFLL